jgi:ribonuclease D
MPPASAHEISDLFIDTPEALLAWLETVKDPAFLAVDTEFVREETYYAELCLIQVGDGRQCACIDARAIADLGPLLRRLDDAATLKLFHAAGQDLEIFVQLSGHCPQPLFDTQLAASLLGYGDQLGYAALVERMLGVKLDKSLSRTDWKRRPLNPAERAYAADDVRYLAQIYPQLECGLRERGRLAWLQEDCARQAQAERYRSNPAQEWRRLKGLARLDRPAQHVAAALAQWRETVAEQRNRPRRWILADEALYRIAERRPQTRVQLDELQVLPPKTLERHADAILAAVHLGQHSEAPVLAVEPMASEQDKKRVRSLLDRLKSIAAELGLPPTLLANRADIEQLAQDGRDSAIPLLAGWRREVAGEILLRTLS